MVLWTIQHQDVYERVMREGVVSGDPSLITQNEFQPAYNYMMRQMEKRGIPRPLGVQNPMWAWYQFCGKRGKQNTRKKDCYGKGARLVQLKIDVPKEEVLLSDFELWHYALNRWYLYLSEEESEECLNVSHTTEEYEQRWEMMFDCFSEVSDDCYYTLPLNKRSIQACFWQLKREHIVSVQFFVGR